MIKTGYTLAMLSTLALANHITPDARTFTTSKAPEVPYATGLVKHDKSYTDSRFPPPEVDTDKKPQED